MRGFRPDTSPPLRQGLAEACTFFDESAQPLVTPSAFQLLPKTQRAFRILDGCFAMHGLALNWDNGKLR